MHWEHGRHVLVELCELQGKAQCGRPSEGRNSGSWEARVMLMKAKCRKAEKGKQKQYEPTYPVFGLYMEWDDKKEKDGWQHKDKIMNGCWLKQLLRWWLWWLVHIRNQGKHKEMWGWSRVWGGGLEAAWVRQWWWWGWWCEGQLTGTALALLKLDTYTVNIYIYTIQVS